MTRRVFKIHCFLLTELIIAIGVFCIITTSYLSIINSFSKRTDYLIKENRAITVIGNVKERLRREELCTLTNAKTVLHDELAKSSLANSKNITEICELRKNTELYIALKYKGNTIMAATIIKLKN